MAQKPGKVIPFRRRRSTGRPGQPHQGWQPTGWQQALRHLRPVLLLIVLVSASYVTALPDAFEPPRFLQTEPEVIAGRFTRCGVGRGYYCVVDGDTFRIGPRKVRVVGIDTAEVRGRCPAEVAQAQASTAALQRWLSMGSFRMTARVDEPVDRYGRELRIVKRINPDGSEDRLADWMQAHGGARNYFGGSRDGWC